MRTLFTLIAITAAAAAATAQMPFPDLELSTASLASPAPGPVVLLIRPDGSGPDLTGARDFAGNLVDGTVLVELRWPDGAPVTGYPWQDLWVASTAEIAVACGYIGPITGFTVDADTDANGRTVLLRAPRGGGYSEVGSNVFISSNPLRGAPLALRWNSPDINGDLRVDLADAGFFTRDLFGAYHFRSDLVHDGVINVSDAGEMSASLGTGCE